jgi:hypothetical protein
MGEGMGAADNHARQRLTGLRNGLLRLHRALLESERATYERDVARIANPNEFLALLMNDPWFAWLRQLSGFVVMVDETLAAEEPATAADADRLVAAARTLLAPAEEGTGFARHYYEALQRDPDVILAHSAMMKVLNGLE